MASVDGSSSTLQKRPPTPKSSSSAPKANCGPPPPIPDPKKDVHPPRRSSLNFLRRTKSGDPVRKVPVVAAEAPKLPTIFNGAANNAAMQAPPSRNGFGREIRDSVAIISGKFGADEEYGNGVGKANPLGGYVPGRKSTDSVVGRENTYVTTSTVPFTEDPYAKEGSMAHRGRYSYASNTSSSTYINSPRRVRRRKDPTPFNVLVIGAKGCGKTSFLRFLRQSLALKPKRGQVITADESPEAPTQAADLTATFNSSYLETDIDGERIGLTLWDSAGLEKNLIDLQIRQTVAFLESKFEETFTEETKVVRAPGVRDTHIHCVFLLLDPARLTPNNHYHGKSGSKEDVGGLDNDLDIAVLKALQGKTVVIPVVSKADNCTLAHMESLKKLVRKGLSRAGVDPLDALDLEIPETDSTGKGNRGSLAEVDEEDNDDLPAAHNSISSAGSDNGRHEEDEGNLSLLPLSVISPDSYEPGEPVGRKFPWGFADPYDEGHCDFVKLKEAVFVDWRGDLREKSRDVWYENWRSDRLGASRKK